MPPGRRRYKPRHNAPGGLIYAAKLLLQGTFAAKTCEDAGRYFFNAPSSSQAMTLALLL
jgi:hypothetical protein